VRDYVPFVHISSLLEEVDARSNAEQPTVPWESWGPRKTRMLTYDDGSRCHVYGTRYIQQESRLLDYRLMMFDFIPLALQRGGSRPVNF
jgi:hypothetical protein